MKRSKKLMTARIILVMISFLSIVHVWYISKLKFIVTKETLYLEDYQIFTKDFKTIVLLTGLLLLLSVFLSSRKTTIKSPGAHWMFSFILTLVFVAGTIAFTNPTGRFPWNERKSYISLATRAIKPGLYASLTKTPELIILGSSVSFTTPADYFKHKWGVNAFNMSINAGGPVDFVTTVNYVIQKSPNGKYPLTFLVELLSPALKVDDSSQTPLKLIPYMPVEKRPAALNETVDLLLKQSSFSDAIFTKLFLDTNRWKIWMKFSKDGTGIRAGENETRSIYQNEIKNNVDMVKYLLSCKNSDIAEKTYLEELVRLSTRYHFSILFYRTPINNDFYKASKTRPVDYEKCKTQFNDYMATITKKNHNVFYKDLSQYPEISSQGMSLYIDTHHLQQNGATLLMQALDPEIKAALEWSKLK